MALESTSYCFSDATFTLMLLVLQTLRFVLVQLDSTNDSSTHAGVPTADDHALPLVL